MNPRTAFSVGGAVVSLTGALRDLRDARADNDRLALVDAIVSAAAVVTGVALAVRNARRELG